MNPESNLMTALKLELASAEGTEKERQTHKKSARIFFNLLEEFYPPKDDTEYWDKLIDRFNAEYIQAGKPRLLLHLICALFEYFDDLVRANTDGG